ncbi:hypothetical protein CsatB_027813 [Cannabis sativa]
MEQSSAGNNGGSLAPPASSQQVTLPKTNIVAFSHSLSVRLDEFNYLPWKHQVLAAIKGSRLQRFLDPNLAPPQYLSDDDRRRNRVSPEFEDLEQQDNILVSWLLSSMSEKVLTRMVGSDSAAQIWINLREYYTSLNRAKIGQYKTLLRNTKMQSSLSDYLLKIKSIIDTLASIGHTTSSQDHIEALFNGLPAEYNVFITSVNTRSEAYSVAEIEALLMVQEVQLDKAAKELDIVKNEANLAHTKAQSGKGTTSVSQNIPSPGSGNMYRGITPTYTQFNPSQPGFFVPVTRGTGPPNRGQFGNFRGGTSRGRGISTTWGQKPQCQLCHKLGHTVQQCFYRFDKSFNGPESFQNFPGHVTANIAEMQAYYATPEVVNDPSWYPDSGATNHLTPNEQNLTTSSSYSGDQQVHMGYFEDFTCWEA